MELFICGYDVCPVFILKRLHLYVLQNYVGGPHGYLGNVLKANITIHSL